jgi:hypothetical protein
MKDGGCDAQKQQLVHIAASSVFKPLKRWQNPKFQACMTSFRAQL